MLTHAAAAASLTIGQLAAHTGVNAKTIQYYESIGLLPRPPRGVNHYRRYGTADVNRLHLLRRIRLLGVPLSVATPLLVGASDARCAEVQGELLALVKTRLRAIDQEVAEPQQLRRDVVGYRSRLAACPVEPVETSQRFSECLDLSCIALPSDQEGAHVDGSLQRAL
jgi:DNA-binding transcriptional MerR regulator